jgi:hypothetical protein
MVVNLRGEVQIKSSGSKAEGMIWMKGLMRVISTDESIEISSTRIPGTKQLFAYYREKTVHH